MRPTAGSAGGRYVTQNQNVAFAENERAGLVAIRPMVALLAAVDDARSAAAHGAASEPSLSELAERMRCAINQSPFAIDEHRALAVTASVGCVVSRLDAVEAAVAAADEALYEAKLAGRDRVVTRALWDGRASSPV